MLLNVNEFINSEVKAGKSYLTVEVPTFLDEPALRTIAFSNPRFIPPISFAEVDGKQSFSYDITADGFAPLSSSASTMSPLEFVIFMRNLTESITQSYDYFLNPCNLLVIEEYLYVNPSNSDVRMIYFPSFDVVSTEDELCRQIFSLARRLSGRPTNDEWKSVILHLWEMTDKTSVREARNIYNKLYNELRNEKPNTSITKPLESDPILMSNLELPAIASKPKKGGLFGSKKVKETKVKKEKKKKVKSSGGIFGRKAKVDKTAEKVPLIKSDEPVSKGLFGKKKQDLPETYASPALTPTVFSSTNEFSSIINTSESTLVPQEVRRIVDGDISITIISLENEKCYIAEYSNGDTFVNGKKVAPEESAILIPH